MTLRYPGKQYYLLAVRSSHLRLAMLFFCILPMNPALSDVLFRTDDGDLYSRALASASSAGSGNMQADPGGTQPNLRMRNSLVIAGGAALVAAYGAQNWWETGFGGGFDTANEGWFGSDTRYGGADKLGHLYSNYAGVRLLTPLFESVGNGRDASVTLAAWSTLGIYTAVEVADGFSRTWKFSLQDALANAAGAALGVALETHPELDAMFDFRVDYRRSPRSSNFDPFGDYSAQKYLFVVKADGFATLRKHSFLRYVEISLGYGTRGYDDGVRHRDAYAGISLNLARLLADAAYDGRIHTTGFQRGTDRLFDLVQFPSIAYERRSVD